MNINLTRSVSENEVKRAVFSINPFSAPGDDGFNAKFYQFFWEIIKEDVIRAVRSFFAGGRMLKSFNHTKICLIPKVTNAISMAQVRPISLCTVFYKVISKILVHRL